MLNLALRVAETSEVNQKHGAVIVKGGSVLALGVNTYTNDPKVFPVDYFNESKNSLLRPNPEAISVHAEIAAIKRCKPETLAGATIYIARISAGGSVGYSAPCDACAEALIQAGVKKIIYTTKGNI